MKKKAHSKSIWGILPAVTGGSCALILLVFFVFEMMIQAKLGPAVESRFGGTITGACIQAGSKRIEVPAVINIVPGGECGKAGLVEGDIIVTGLSLAELYRLLDGPAGKEVVLDVVPGGNGPPFDKRQRKSITL